MLSRMKEKVGAYELYVILFSNFWVGFVGLDYINKHPVYIESIIYFRYYKLVGFLLLYGGLFSWFLSSKHKSLVRWNQLLFIPVSFFSFLLILLSMAIAYSEYYFFPLATSDYLQYLSNSFSVVLYGSLMLLSLYSLGSFVVQKYIIGKVLKKSNVMIDLGIGMMLFTFLLIPLAALHLINVFVLLPILIFFFIIRYQFWIDTIKNIKGLTPSFSRIQYFIFYLMMLIAALNFVFVISAYPLGFDSRNYYVNLSLLIVENNGFVKGFQPHNWELFTATGKAITGKNELILFLSYVVGLLSAWATHYLARWFKIDKTLALLLALLLICTPAVGHQMFIEFKVDLGLLFIQIVTLHIYLKYDRMKKREDHNSLPFLILMGLLFGFGLGIKLLHFFLIYGIFCALALKNENKALLYAVALLGLGFILLLKLDNQTGLRSLHPHADQLGYLITVLGIGLLVYSGFKDFLSTKKAIVQMAIISLISVMTFLPWIYKSYSETPTTDVVKLLRGNSPGHVIDQSKMRELYNRSQDQQ